MLSIEPSERRMVPETALPNLLRKTLRRLEKDVPPDDPALQELKIRVVRSVAELEIRKEERPLEAPDEPEEYEEAA